MKVLILLAALTIVNSTPFPELGTKCNIAEGIFWRLPSNQNPNTYYHCENKVVVLGTCAPGTGFLKTGDEACTPFTSWSCLEYDPVLTCNNKQHDQLRAVSNPNYFSFCMGGKIRIASCSGDNGFASGVTSFGCMPWSNWNAVTNCLES